MAVLWAMKSKKIASVFVCILFGYDSNVFFFKVYYFQSLKKIFCEKSKDLACSFFNAHALIDKRFIVLHRHDMTLAVKVALNPNTTNYCFTIVCRSV